MNDVQDTMKKKNWKHLFTEICLVMEDNSTPGKKKKKKEKKRINGNRKTTKWVCPSLEVYSEKNQKNWINVKFKLYNDMRKNETC